MTPHRVQEIKKDPSIATQHEIKTLAMMLSVCTDVLALRNSDLRWEHSRLEEWIKLSRQNRYRAARYYRYLVVCFGWALVSTLVNIIGIFWGF